MRHTAAPDTPGSATAQAGSAHVSACAAHRRTVVRPDPTTGPSRDQVAHTWCILGLASSGESASSPPSWPLARATQAGELVGDAAPLGVRELVPGLAVGERSQHASAGPGGVEHRADVLVETGRFLDVGNRRASAFGGASFLRGEASAFLAAPSPRASRRPLCSGDERPSASGALLDHCSSSSRSDHSKTVRGCQRRCLPTRNPLGPLPVVRQA